MQDNIYENVGSPTANRIARVELEAYLNKVIGTQDAADDFKVRGLKKCQLEILKYSRC